MRPRTTAILGAIFFALVSLYLYTNVRKVIEIRQAWEAKRLFPFQPADIESLSIQQQGADAIEAARTEGAWRFVGERSAIAADAAQWEKLAAAVAVATNERPIADKGAKLVDFGLDTPLLTIAVTPKGGSKSMLAFGGLDPTQRNRYALGDDGSVFLVRAEIFSALDRPFLELRDRRIFTNLGDGLARVDYERLPVETPDADKLNDDVKQLTTAIHESYAKSDSGEWRMTAPRDVHAWQDRLALLERALQTITGREYIDRPENLADYGLNTPAATVVAYGKDGKPQTLLIGWPTDDSNAPGLYVKRADADWVAVIDGSIRVLLPRGPDWYAEKRLFTGEAKQLARVHYHDPSSDFELENTADQGWRLVGDGANDTDQKEASFYIATLKAVQGENFPAADVPAAFENPRMTMDITMADGAKKSIVIGAPVPDSDPLTMYARQDFGGLTTISVKNFVALRADRFRFRNKQFFSFEPGLASDVEMTLDGAQYHFVQANGRWSIAEPPGKSLGAQSYLTGFLDAVIKTAATGIVESPPAADALGMAAPVLELTVQVAGPNAHTVGPIRIGNLTDAASRDRYVTISGRDGVYTVEQSLVDRARDVASAIQGQ